MYQCDSVLCCLAEKLKIDICFVLFWSTMPFSSLKPWIRSPMCISGVHMGDLAVSPAFAKNHLQCDVVITCSVMTSQTHTMYQHMQLFLSPIYALFHKWIGSHMRSDRAEVSANQSQLQQPQGQLGNSAVLAGERKGMRERESNRFPQLTSTVREQTCKLSRAVQGSMGAVLSGLDAGGLAPSQR